MTGLVSGALLWGRVSAKPNKLQQIGFDVCNGEPCFMGITLGMSWAEARAILTKKKELIDDTDTLIVLRVQNLNIGVRPDNSQGHVEEIEFNIWPDNDPEVPLSNIISLYDHPCSVTTIFILDMLERIVINYPEIHFTVGDVSPNTVITSLTMSKTSDRSYCAGKKVEGLRVNQWKGFRGLPYYMVDRSPQ
ncbi:MAG: hypothetical protein IT324_28505 [Anaerolineae bacterium]|nr:hypothetical protein [Anaerolineae bacterium]